jgi:Outer membrane protein beta-barrel domain
MLHLQWTKTFNIILRNLYIGIALLIFHSSQAQKILYQEDHDRKPYYFGITLVINKASFHTDLDKSFLYQDSIMLAQPTSSAGFSLGLAATTRLSPRFEMRFNPQLIFTERDIYYKLRYPDINNLTDVIKKVESVITTFPVDIKFNSDRIGNFRVYMLGGGKIDLDLASNAKARKADDMIQIGKYDYGIEAGFGMNFYFPSFIFSPEIKFSNGLNNLHIRNDNLNYSRVLDRIQSRMIMFTIHLEG